MRPFDQQRLLLGASALLMRHEQQQVVLVKPVYKQVWHLPGGLMEEGESPRQAAQRETKEEVGLEAVPGRLLVVDFKSANDERSACLQFIFDGGMLSTDQLSDIVLQQDEIEAWRAVPADEAVLMVAPGGPASRLANALEALDSSATLYLEDGRIV